MTERLTVLTLHANGICELALNRPEKHNAFHPELMQELIDTLEELTENPSVRVLILKGNGPSFSSGADLNYMKSMVNYSHEENVEDAGRLSRLLQTLNNFPRPVVCAVNGNAFAGATGLIACCDIIVAATDARFCISEVRLGIAPAVIGPYVIARIGPHHARRLFLSAEVFDASTACLAGLVHHLVEPEELEKKTWQIANSLLNNAPGAMAATKALIHEAAPVTDPLLTEYTCELIATLRAGDEGQQGLQSFFSKQKAPWVPEDD